MRMSEDLDDLVDHPLTAAEYRPLVLLERPEANVGQSGKQVIFASHGRPAAVGRPGITRTSRVHRERRNDLVCHAASGTDGTLRSQPSICCANSGQSPASTGKLAPSVASLGSGGASTIANCFPPLRSA